MERTKLQIIKSLQATIDEYEFAETALVPVSLLKDALKTIIEGLQVIPAPHGSTPEEEITFENSNEWEGF